MLINYEKDGMIESLYGMIAPNKKAMSLRQKKVDALKKQMGDKYLLAKSVERLNGRWY